jgi:hypothetical protein
MAIANAGQSGVGRAILPAAGFQPAGPAGKQVRSQEWLPHNSSCQQEIGDGSISEMGRSYRENVSTIASAIASAYSSSTKWPPSK